MTVVRCEPDEWRDHWARLASAGARWFEFMTAVDRRQSIEVIGRAAVIPGAAGPLLSTSLAIEGATLDSICEVFPGAAWYEREIAEMFGVAFSGLDDSRPLLRRSVVGNPPMLRSSVLAARALKPWPGAAEPGGRSRQARSVPAPGAPAGWLEERDS